ncbi:flagellar hook-length control protein FliK [bacterium]|nr:flagellar hook-length control protein FliK [bacterium]
MDLGVSSSRRSGGYFESSVKPTTKADDTSGIKKTFSIEEAQGINKNIGAPGSVETTTKVAASKPTTKNDPTSPTQPRETVSRPISRSDIVDQLVQIKHPPTSENIQIMSSILQFGLEASAQNFETVQTLLKGRKANNSLESSVVSVSKGLAEAPRSVDIIGHFLNNQLEISQQFQQLQNAMANFKLNLNWSSELFTTGLLTGLTSILGDLDESLKKFSKSSKEKANWNPASRTELINDFKSMLEFLGGLRQKIGLDHGDSPSAKRILEASQQLQHDISGFLEALTSQAIMSEQIAQTGITDRFGYWQFPNPWMNGKSSIELLIRKDPLKKKTEYNPQKTRVIIKFETQDLGEMCITLDVLDKKVWMQVNTSKTDSRMLLTQWIGEFKEQLSVQNYELAGLQTSDKPISIRNLILPKLNLDNLSRINTEV